MTFKISSSYKMILLVFLGLLSYFCAKVFYGQISFLENIEKPHTEKFVILEIFIFSCVIIANQFSQKIYFINEDILTKDLFSEKKLKTKDVLGYVYASGVNYAPSPTYYLIGNSNQILWSFTKTLGLKVFEDEDKLIKEIVKFKMLNLDDFLFVFRMKMSKMTILVMLMLFTMPFQIMILEML